MLNHDPLLAAQAYAKESLVDFNQNIYKLIQINSWAPDSTGSLSTNIQGNHSIAPRWSAQHANKQIFSDEVYKTFHQHLP